MEFPKNRNILLSPRGSGFRQRSHAGKNKPVVLGAPQKKQSTKKNESFFFPQIVANQTVIPL